MNYKDKPIGEVYNEKLFDLSNENEKLKNIIWDQNQEIHDLECRLKGLKGQLSDTKEYWLQVVNLQNKMKEQESLILDQSKKIIKMEKENLIFNRHKDKLYFLKEIYSLFDTLMDIEQYTNTQVQSIILDCLSKNLKG